MLIDGAVVDRDKINFLNIEFNNIGIERVLNEMEHVTSQSKFRYVVTPNVDHVVRSANPSNTADAALRSIYAAADFCLCDSRILARLARLRGIHLRLVPGSDLTARIFAETLEADDRIAIVGGDEAIADAVRTRYPLIAVTQHIPPMGLRDNKDAIDKAARFAMESGARFIFIAVGSPQQELVAHAIASYPQARGCALCVGASIDFIVGRQQRAPRIVQHLGLEWAHRLLQNPRRLWRRYMVDSPRIFAIAAKWRPKD